MATPKANMCDGVLNFNVFHAAYASQWLKEPESKRPRENKRLTALITGPWLESAGNSGSPRIHVDLCEAGEACSENRVARLMALAGLKAILAKEIVLDTLLMAVWHRHSHSITGRL